MNSINLKFGDVTARRSPTFSDCHYVMKIIFSPNYYFLSMFSIFVVLFNIVCHLLMSCHNFSLFIRVPCILFYGDLLTLKTHHYKPNSMNSLNSMKVLWKNSNERLDRKRLMDRIAFNHWSIFKEFHSDKNIPRLLSRLK